MSRAATALAALALALGLFASGAAAQAKGPLTREQALAGVQSPDLETRRHATAWLGEVGVIADAPVLIGALSDQDEVIRALAEHSVWQVWSRSGDTEADSLLQIGIEQMNRGDGPAAVETFTKVIQRKPDFAEAWNKRATVYFFMGEHEKSLRDCDEVMKRNPVHFGALAGYGQLYLQLDQPERALEYFRRALRVNPNLGAVRQIIPQLEQLLTERRKGTI
ncbi:MAG TPA: tetratricopeptide repeat protein [Candidatus Deferrimicrobiaceae bacterium]|nr:tetratricopeptide repeat protein [Candidatus Deferrimicrobiaceae bacterium]